MTMPSVRHALCALSLAAGCGGASPPPTAPVQATERVEASAEPAPPEPPAPVDAPERPLRDLLHERLPGAWTFAGEGRGLPSGWTIDASGSATLCQSVLCADVPWTFVGDHPSFDFGDGTAVRLLVEEVGESTIRGTYGTFPIGGGESAETPAPFTLTRAAP